MADVGGVAYDGENDVRLRSDRVRRGSPVGTDIEKGLCFGLGTGEDGESVASFD